MNEQDGNMIERMAGLRRYQLLLAPLFIYTQRMDELMDETMAFKDYGTVGAGGGFVLQTTTTPFSCTFLQVVQLLRCNVC